MCSSFLVFMCFIFCFFLGHCSIIWLQLSLKYLTTFCINIMSFIFPPNLLQYIIPRSHASREYNTSYI
ncbi:hypothetical protein FR483_n541R [Paramecium bursaria Chlorella virus FR483]|uniref:Uncharacterized protein n541R n=1 Tax=Paramecium bursaria Chlorella virus FR483 TaxID=399781 RepID=A7J7P5_PBCVF|nr:hypothetical protein FR483_n541R [Paramecium bursaria Chlorella virus FR483]ABT15826.1 hypothetical protein FR483_n541R [Paramecium bursaria Chlorella virus FR483]